MIIGISGSRQGPSAALLDGRALAASEESRLARLRLSERTTFPRHGLRELAAFLGRRVDDITAVAVTSGGQFPGRDDVETVDHHLAHAAYAFHASGFDSAAVVVCDSATERGWTAWRGVADGLTRVEDDLGAFPLAHLYSDLTGALGLAPGRDEHIVEAMARVGRATEHPVAAAFAVHDEGLIVDARWRERLAVTPGDQGSAGTPAQVAAATAVQAALAEALLALLARVQRATGATRVCLSGGLFYNTHFTTEAATRGPFAEVFVPPHPGNGGAAIGAALSLTRSSDRSETRSEDTFPDRHIPHPRSPHHDVTTSPDLPSPFLGPSFTDEQIKATLDNCKLVYTLMDDERVVQMAVAAMMRGALVGWFDGRMEWGPRALGHRSVLAGASGPHVLDNLNGFLKQRPWYRAYGVSVPASRVQELFEGPPVSDYMQFEYRPRDPRQFAALLPPGTTRLRVHTVDARGPRMLRLLEVAEAQSGAPVLVNTSFNGFHEPLVCTPRDAVRVFYGTGLDVLSLGRFVIRK
ncbi:MAG: carbamoyltransferase C-terminal domain-containing protein [Vicinamibacterales bacterium]|nr:carbamoyltransferase C-terminal domain-containing protein [Vicinamibacterales bacterium]